MPKILQCHTMDNGPTQSVRFTVYIYVPQAHGWIETGPIDVVLIVPVAPKLELYNAVFPECFHPANDTGYLLHLCIGTNNGNYIGQYSIILILVFKSDMYLSGSFQNTARPIYSLRSFRRGPSAGPVAGSKYFPNDTGFAKTLEQVCIGFPSKKYI